MNQGVITRKLLMKHFPESDLICSTIFKFFNQVCLQTSPIAEFTEKNNLPEKRINSFRTTMDRILLQNGVPRFA